MENESREALNPWISIWTQPRATIQQIIDTDPEKSVYLLAAAAGCISLLAPDAHEFLHNMGLMSILLLALLAGPIFGVINLYIFTGLIQWTGDKWLGGKGTDKTIKAAIAWSHVPTIEAVTLWVPAILLFGQEYFTGGTAGAGNSLNFSPAYKGLGVVDSVITIWTFIILLKCVGQAQGFSAWKALANLILSALVLIFLLLPIVLVVGLFL